MLSFILLFGSIFSYAEDSDTDLSDKISIAGYVTDASTGEALIGATVYIREIEGGTTTNMYGFYSVTLEEGNYILEFRYIGFFTVTKEITLNENTEINVELAEDSRQLEEVIVIGKTNSNVKRIDMSVNKLDIQTIEKIPALLGEVDIIQSL